MPKSSLTRRGFFRDSSAAIMAGAAVPYFWIGAATAADAPRSANDRARIGAIGMRLGED